MPAIYKFPYDSPIRYLPLVYILPYDLLVRCPTLRRLPRSMGALNASPEWGKVILSEQFLNEVMDAVASLAFPYFGFGGWKEHYTGWCPVWRLSYALPLWAKGIERLTGWGVQSLFNLPPGFEIPFFDTEEVKGAIKLVVEQTIEEHVWNAGKKKEEITTMMEPFFSRLEKHLGQMKKYQATIDYLTQENEGLREKVRDETSIQKRMEVLTLKKENERLQRFVQNIPPEIRQAIKQQQWGQRREDYQR